MKHKKNDFFQNYHPAVNFLYFASVLGFSAALSHPAARLISLFCAFSCAKQFYGTKTVIFSLKFCLPLLLLTAIANPAFNHRGATILAYLPTGNPLTLESISYGLSSGIMLATVLLWFISFNRVISSDKLIYLFGKIFPSLALLLSMTLRFAPVFAQRLKTVKDAQKSMGKDISKGNIFKKIKTAGVILSATVAWSLENAEATALSMKSRGYGLKGRSSFSVYLLNNRDKTALAWLGFCCVYLTAGFAAGGFSFNFFPYMAAAPLNALTLSFYFIYLFMCLTAVYINIYEGKKWKSSHSDM